MEKLTASQNTRISAVKCMVSLRKGYMNKSEAMANINKRANAEGQESCRVPPLNTEQQGINEKREREGNSLSQRWTPYWLCNSRPWNHIDTNNKNGLGWLYFYNCLGGVHMWMSMHETIIIKDKETISLKVGSGSCEELEGGKRRENVAQSYFN